MWYTVLEYSRMLLCSYQALAEAFGRKGRLMKFVRYVEKVPGAQPVLGLLSQNENSVHPLSSLLSRDMRTMQQLIVSLKEEELPLLMQAARCDGIPLSQVSVLAPIDRPLHDILCVGVNYRDHREETKTDLPTEGASHHAVYFGKRAHFILGDGKKIPARLDLDSQLDYEVELAVIIGKEGRDISPEQAEDYIFGYSVFNDLSSRTIQKQHSQWLRGKSLDGYTAMGPCILHKSALPFPVEVDVCSLVNGEIRQNSNTRLLLTSLPQIIADLSQGMTLEPGDIIATGTPGGVGLGFDPPRFLKKGDKVECRIPPIGSLCNTVE